MDQKYDILPAVLDFIWLKPGVHIIFIIEDIEDTAMPAVSYW